jgi:hypothetical protein
MRKEIVLPNELLKDLKTVAFHADKSVKKYMEDAVIQKIKEDIKRVKK